jgi:AraC-like DNA-binding protein
MLDDLDFMRESLNMFNDPFSDLLQLMSARSVLSGGLVTGGSWAIAFPAVDTLKFWGVMKGGCWLVMAGEAAPIRVEDGDVFLLSAPRAHVLCSDLNAIPVDLDRVLQGRTGVIVQHGSGDDFFMIGGKVELQADNGQLLRDALPTLIHIRADSASAQALRWLLDQLVQERDEQRPGAAVASAQLAHLMFIQILRAHFESGVPLAGSLRVLGDKRLAPALRLMHDDPGRAWQLTELANAAAMSRATFAATFKNIAGVAPMVYLTQWRMRLAERALREERTSVIILAQSLGYTSQSAFSTAFKRITGCSPQHYRSRVKANVLV